MTTDATNRSTGFRKLLFGQNWFRAGLLTIGLSLFLVILILLARWWFMAPAPLQSGDLLLLDQESIVRVKAAARAGDLLAQSALGSAYLQGTRTVPKSVPEAVYWLRKVTDRDPAEFELISNRMEVLLDNRLFEVDSQRQREMDLEYLDLAAKRLAYESAFLEIVHVNLGGQGDAYANVPLALKYLRLGAASGLPSSQRNLGIVTRFGWLGVPKNEIQAVMLLSEAAAQGDRVAKRLLVDFRFFQASELLLSWLHFS